MEHFSSEICLGSKTVSTNSGCYVIAEAGVNHNGDVEIAKEMISRAVDTGVDAIKFQIFNADELILKEVKKASYQSVSSPDESQYQMLKSLELKNDDFVELKKYCDYLGISFLATPFDNSSLEFLLGLDIDAIKVASTDTTNYPFLKKIANGGKPVILSTGMCNMEEVRIAVETIKPINKDLILLQCTSSYPTPLDKVNIRVMNTYATEFSCLVGFSDHTPGLGASPYAVAAGAKVIEKHYTLDKMMSGPDHQASLEISELADLVKDIRRVESMLGSSAKTVAPSEVENKKSLQKSIVATQTIREGEIFSEQNLAMKRTGGLGLSSLFFDKIIGKKSCKNFSVDEVIDLEPNNL